MSFPLFSVHPRALFSVHARSALFFLLPSLFVSGAASAQTAKIAGGTVAQECGFAPGVAWTSTCSSLLIHPQVMLFAGHCNPYLHTTEMHFTHEIPEDFDDFDAAKHEGRVLPIDYCKNWETGATKLDIAFCVLEEPHYDLPIIPPA